MLGLVGGAGEGRPAAHRLVGLHKLRGPLSQLGVPAKHVRVDQVHRPHVERGRHGDGRPAGHQSLGKLQAGVAVVEAAVDVGRFDVEQMVCAIDAGHRDQNAHGHPRGLAHLAGQHGLVPFV